MNDGSVCELNQHPTWFATGLSFGKAAKRRNQLCIPAALARS